MRNRWDAALNPPGTWQHGTHSSQPPTLALSECNSGTAVTVYLPISGLRPDSPSWRTVLGVKLWAPKPISMFPAAYGRMWFYSPRGRNQKGSTWNQYCLSGAYREGCLPSPTSSVFGCNDILGDGRIAPCRHLDFLRDSDIFNIIKGNIAGEKLAFHFLAFHGMTRKPVADIPKHPPDDLLFVQEEYRKPPSLPSETWPSCTAFGAARSYIIPHLGWYADANVTAVVIN